jgi:hypothetical protein
MRIDSVRTSCGCTIAQIADDKRVIEPGETGAIVARINSERFQGDRGATVTARISRPNFPAEPPVEVQMQVKVFIRGDVHLEPGSVRFGQIEHGTAYVQTVTVRCGDGYGASSLEGVESHNPLLTAELVPAGSDWRGRTYELRVRIDEHTPPGYISDFVTLKTGTRGGAIPVPVEGQVMSGLTVSPSRLFLGSVKPGQRVSKTIVVRGDAPFHVTGIRCDADDITWQLPNEATAHPIHVIPLTFTAGKSNGMLSRSITVATDLRQLTATVSARAIVEAPSATHHEVAKPVAR